MSSNISLPKKCRVWANRSPVFSVYKKPINWKYWEKWNKVTEEKPRKERDNFTDIHGLRGKATALHGPSASRAVVPASLQHYRDGHQPPAPTPQSCYRHSIIMTWNQIQATSVAPRDLEMVKSKMESGMRPGSQGGISPLEAAKCSWTHFALSQVQLCSKAVCKWINVLSC